ncbi:MAG: DnaJ domain-containing protein [Chitinophagales bacterium]|nr:DnaJ domain-containing protein [Chitinophagales bacterium]
MFSFSDFWDTKRPSTSGRLTPQQKARQEEIENSLLLLTAEVLRCGNPATGRAEEYLAGFFDRHFGTRPPQQRMQVIRAHIATGAGPYLRIAARQLVLLTTYDTRLTALHFLYAVASADDFITDKQSRCIRRLAGYLQISAEDLGAVQQKYLQKSDPYAALGLAHGAPIEDVKRAYRKLVMQHHPDKQSGRASSEKFLEIQRAYERIVRNEENS